MRNPAYSFLSVIILLILALPVQALYRFPLPAGLIGQAYDLETRLKKDGNLFGRASETIEQRSDNGKNYVVITTIFSGELEGRSLSSETYRYFLLEEGRITIDSISGKTVRGGEQWTEYRIDFNWPKLSARANYQDYAKPEQIEKEVPLDPKMVAVQDLELYLSFLPTRKVKEEKLKVLLPNGETFNLLLKLVEQPESLIVQGQEIVCRRIELKPDLGLISLIIPNADYWVRNAPPHQFVRYNGLLSGPGSPDVIRELRVK